MMSFRNHRLENTALGGATVWLLTDIAEAKGRQEVVLAGAPERVDRLRESAIVQSAESSNRIEGVEVEPDRLVPLVLEGARPRNRSEEEVQGYRRALDLIHSEARQLPVTPEVILRLHAIAQEGAGDAGQWKQRDNEIVEFPSEGGGGPPRVRFTPTSARETPEAMAELCRWYVDAVDQRRVPPLVAIAALALDFLCVHPFRDGNGRVARLLTLLALYHADYEVGRFISLERLIEETRDEYYENLRLSSQAWHEGKHDLGPWLNYFLVIVRRAYIELGEKATETA
ncbi:MAG TPA: Fic family protein [Tepidisphaeraceae bacterium]|jgi:Fic family protein